MRLDGMVGSRACLDTAHNNLGQGLLETAADDLQWPLLTQSRFIDTSREPGSIVRFASAIWLVGDAPCGLEPVQGVGYGHETIDPAKPGVESLAIQAISYSRTGFHYLQNAAGLAEFVGEARKSVRTLQIDIRCGRQIENH